MLNWEGRGTRFPPGFTTMRIETNSLWCWATERTPQPGSAAAKRCMNSPVHLVCRALRMAPACYCRFELTAKRQHLALQIFGGGIVHVGGRKTLHKDRSSTFGSISDLAAAMQQYAAAESLSVHVLPEERSIVVDRIVDASRGGASTAQ